MARTSIQNIQSLPDMAQSWNFNLFFPTIPGGSTSGVTYKCQTTTLPASNVETVKIELGGVAKQEAGRATYDHTFTATFLETVDYSAYMAFRAWRDFMRSWKNNTGSDSSAYKINLELDLFDNAGNVSKTIILVGAFVTALPEITFESTSSTIVNMGITFSFDYLNDGFTF